MGATKTKNATSSICNTYIDMCRWRIHVQYYKSDLVAGGTGPHPKDPFRPSWAVWKKAALSFIWVDLSVQRGANTRGPDLCNFATFVRRVLLISDVCKALTHSCIPSYNKLINDNYDYDYYYELCEFTIFMIKIIAGRILS